MTDLRYVYAVCRPFDTPPPAALTGVAGGHPRLLHHGDLVAVVADVPERDFAEEPLHAHLEDLDWLGETARAHERVIDACSGLTTTLPLRLATVFHDDEGVRRMLTAQDAALRSTLDRLEGRVEWGVKVYAEPEDEPAGRNAGQGSAGEGSVGEENAGRTTDRPASGRDYLRQRRHAVRAREDTWERAERFANRLHTDLTAHAEAARLHPLQSGPLATTPGHNVLNAAYLLPRTGSRAFMDLVEGVRGTEPGISVQLTGPWAAYSFIGDALGQEEARR
ncbi:GvpL/GvpF family gas vesicle protein [Streptomyces sp. NPDC091377]|uniref:GvpL/GvpF family gas vesicle protein n=1 Tax=Streptomyces sp. NPDC091377 TaxID=3365995 RepID=UPI0037F64C53